MSMELMVKAMKTKVGNPLRKLVLIKLADNANDMGECWPSYQHIADQCEIGRSTVKVHIRELEKSGLLRREFRRKGELNQSNVFHLALEGGAAPALGGRAGDNPPGAGDNPGGGAGAAPRTSHSSEPVKEPVKPKVADAPGLVDFDRFWVLYPRKVGKSAAEKAWAKIKVTADLFDLMVKALAAWSVSTDWTKDGGQYIPHASTWLNGKRWEDELPQSAGSSQPATRRQNNEPDFNDSSWAEGLMVRT
ncbi:helix-turn-helix domain-containing protein [Pseudomonas faucium]|uniref:helix-turn-helix domain-containing protein n=1 Tax=Pseudomonas faucium TaxID=2740518 RepID=UPI001F1B1E89|nr:helix-turn-helix domain-containing protein [Pseudomonas faucium]